MTAAQTYQDFLGLAPWGMGVTEQGLSRSVGPNVIPAHKGTNAEPIGERECWHPETQGRQRVAVATNGRPGGALHYGKAAPSGVGSQSHLPTLTRGSA